VKLKVTIVVPTEQSEGGGELISSFLDSKIESQIKPQFVVLQNPRTPGKSTAQRYNLNSHEAIYISADRYFGSCEENIYRVQGFSSEFNDYVFFVGGHDNINWIELAAALDFANKNKLDACAWNIRHAQMRHDGDFSTALSIDRATTTTLLGTELIASISGTVHPAKYGFPILISSFGPVDWAAYIGSHLFRRGTLERILSYRFSEQVYSFVFKQLMYFSSREDLRYAFYEPPVITRISDEFLQSERMTDAPKTSWLQEHRMVTGGSPVFFISILDYLSCLNERLFMLVTSSFCYSHRKGSSGEISGLHHPLLVNLIKWSAAAAEQRISGKSSILGDAANASALFEINYIRNFLDRLINALSAPDVHPSPEDATRKQLVIAKYYIDLFLADDNRSTVSLAEARNALLRARATLTNSTLRAWNAHYLDSYLKAR
jgi:hypothetical protein